MFNRSVASRYRGFNGLSVSFPLIERATLRTVSVLRKILTKESITTLKDRLKEPRVARQFLLKSPTTFLLLLLLSFYIGEYILDEEYRNIGKIINDKN